MKLSHDLAPWIPREACSTTRPTSRAVWGVQSFVLQSRVFETDRWFLSYQENGRELDLPHIPCREGLPACRGSLACSGHTAVGRTGAPLFRGKVLGVPIGRLYVSPCLKRTLCSHKAGRYLDSNGIRDFGAFPDRA